MEILSNAPAVTAAKSNTNKQHTATNTSYTKSMMASKALQNSGNNNEVNISNLEKGDVFKGEITNITGRNVTVSLGNGQVLKAVMLENVAINIGNNLYFEVKEKDDEKIVIHPLTDEKFSPENQTIEKALRSAGLQLNEKNMVVVKELMDASMPIDRTSIMKVLQQLVNHSNANIKSIIQMIKCNIPITDSSIIQFEQYMGKQQQLLVQMNQLSSTIEQMYQSYNSEDTFAGDLLRLNQQMINIFGADATDVSLFLPLSEAFSMSEAEITSFLDQNAALELNEDGSVLTDGLGNRYPEGSLLRDKAGNIMLDEKGQLQFQKDFYNQLSEEQKQSISKGTFYSEQADSNSGYPNPIQARLADMLQELGMTEDMCKQFLHPKQSIQQLLSNIQNFVVEQTSLTDDTLKQFFASKEYAFLLENVMDSQWKLKPEQLKQEQQIEKLYMRLEHQTRQLSDLGKQFSGSGEELSRQADNMNQNLKFMQLLNEHYTYAQFPLQLTNQDTNGELYVYTNKKALSKDKKDISVLLHLDMEYLGSTDIHIALNGTKVTARFYMEDFRSLNTIKNHIMELQDKINALGLSLETEVLKRPDKKPTVNNFVDDFLAKDLPASQQVKRYNFDMRA